MTERTLHERATEVVADVLTEKSDLNTEARILATLENAGLIPDTSTDAQMLRAVNVAGALYGAGESASMIALAVLVALTSEINEQEN